MRNMKQRMLALVCCLVLVVSGLYITEPKEASAAEASKISLSTDMRYFTIDTADTDAGFWNVAFTGKPADYTSHGANVVQGGDYTWVSENITFGGGMTQEDFIDGLYTIYIANGTTFQINFKNRTTAFQEGWFFSIKQGALLPYNGSNAYVALDKEYEFTFGAGSGTEGGYHNIVSVTAYNTTTFSMATNPTSDLGNGSSGSRNFKMTIENYSSLPDAYTYRFMTEDSAYDGYIDFNGVDDNASLVETGLQVQYILSNTDSNTREIQVTAWGNWRETLTTGGYWAFKQGLPIYWTSGGENYKAVLDATYVYYVTGFNTGNTQTYRCFKFDSEANNYGLEPFEGKSTSTQSNGYFINIPMSAEIATGSKTNYVEQKLARKYYDFARWTDEELATYGVRLDLIMDSKVLQLVINGAGVNALEVGDTITLKDGLPIAYVSNGAYVGATLQGNYTITVTAKTDTTNTSVTTGGDGSVTFSMIETGTFGLTGSVGNLTGESNAKYQNMYLDVADFSDASGTFSGNFDSATVIENYFYAERGGKAIDLTTEGWYFKYYYLTGSDQMVRYYCPENYETFTDGDYIIWRQGLPITYTTTKGTQKTVTLDKDYGYVWSAADGKFVYDKNLVYDDTVEEIEEHTFTAKSGEKTTVWQDATSDYRLTLGLTISPENATSQWVNILANTDSYPYIDICGYDLDTLVENGVELLYIPHAKALQFDLTEDLSWMEVGDTITLKKGLPVTCKYNETTVTATLTDDITYTVTAASATSVTVDVLAEGAEYTLGTEEFGFNNSEAYGPTITICDPTSGEQTVLDDAQGKYEELDDDIVAKYIDIAGMTAQDLAAHNVKFRWIKNGDLEVIQMQVGTLTGALAPGDRITFKAGLPITYATTAGLKKTITLAADVVYRVNEGNTSYACTVHQTNEEVGEWDFEFGAVSVVEKNETEGYYNNIKLSDGCDMKREVTGVTYQFNTAQMKKYIDFAGLDVDTYGFQAYAIINASNQVIQLRWGSATSQIEAGAQIIFKEGLPIYANVVQDGEPVSKVYLLSRDVVFSIEEYTDGANGYRLNSVREESKATPGDVDGDYLQNVNDVNLMRKHLAELINVSDTKALDANADAAVNIKDLVRVKKAFGTIAEPETYTSIYESCNLTSVVASATGKKADDAKMTITFGDGNGVSLGTDTYLRLTYKTSQDLRGYFVYTVNGGSEVEEEFYLEAKASQFRQFLDVYRPNGINGDLTVSEIVLKRIELYNLSTENAANVIIHEVEHAGRTVVTDNMVWAQTSDIKIGVDMNMGGSLAYMECLKYNVYEYLNTSSREVIIGTEDQYNSLASKIDSDTDDGVNLINIYDWGRQIQQSYYSYPSGSTNWEGTAFAPGKFGDSTDWPYNPVQAGDQNYNRSQIVDYRAIDTNGDETNDFIYVKTRAMDWSKDNETTDSYMENWYRVEGALVYVENNYIDWSGFGRSTKLLTQELPALYVGQSFNTLVADANGADDIHTGLGIWTAEDRYHNNTTTTNWYAFVNKEATSQDDSSAFGVGIYIPNVDGTTAGRVVEQRGYRALWGSDNRQNVNANNAPILGCNLPYINEMANNAVELGSIWGDVYVQNCFVSNASYIAPRCTGYMTGYKDYSYTYVLTADTLDNINASFTAIDESGEVTNESLGNW